MVLNTPIQNNLPTILITGSNGLLGQKLINALKSGKEFNVLATGRGQKRLPASWDGFKYESMDIVDSAQVMSVFQEFRPKVVIHAASMTNVDQCETEKEACFEQNVIGVRNVIEACKEIRSHLIYVSTDFIFDGKSGPYSEESTAGPVNYYGETKLEAEKLIMASDLDWAIIRTALVYGIAHDMSRSNIILWVKSGLEQGKEMKLVDDQFRTPTLAEDLAAGCILVAKKRATGVFNISGRDFLTPFQMAVKTADFFKLDQNKIQKVDSSTFQQPAKRPPVTGFIIDKAVRELGYEPSSFEEGIAILSQQFKELNFK